MANQEKPLIIKVQDFLSKKWDFRYNEVLGRTEFRSKSDSLSDYQILTDYDLNSIHLELTEKEYNISFETVRKLLKSKYVKRFNPFYEYFNNLPKWDETTDYIDMLASTVETTNDDFFRKTFKKWIVAMAASLVNDKLINHTFLIFMGEQGVGKTTWINNLVPEELREYYYSGSINPNNSDSKIQLAENMLINIDELQGLSPKGLEDLKSLITIRDIKTRRPYASIHESLPHRASFAGSVNATNFLNDTTGNRRFLCFEVKGIEYEHNISMDDVFSQALYLFKDGYIFYLNKEEIMELNENNEAFIQRSIEEDILTHWLAPCPVDDSLAIFGTTTDILKSLAVMDDKIKVNDSSLQKVGKLLRKYDFPRIKKNSIWVYSYKIISAPQYGYSEY